MRHKTLTLTLTEEVGGGRGGGGGGVQGRALYSLCNKQPESRYLCFSCDQQEVPVKQIWWLL